MAANSWNETWSAKPTAHQFRTFPKVKTYRAQKGDWSGTIPVHPHDERDFLDFCHHYGWQVNEEEQS